MCPDTKINTSDNEPTQLQTSHNRNFNNRNFGTQFGDSERLLESLAVIIVCVLSTFPLNDWIDNRNTLALFSKANNVQSFGNKSTKALY